MPCSASHGAGFRANVIRSVRQPVRTVFLFGRTCRPDGLIALYPDSMNPRVRIRMQSASQTKGSHRVNNLYCQISQCAKRRVSATEGRSAPRPVVPAGSQRLRRGDGVAQRRAGRRQVSPWDRRHDAAQPISHRSLPCVLRTKSNHPQRTARIDYPNCSCNAWAIGCNPHRVTVRS